MSEQSALDLLPVWIWSTTASGDFIDCGAYIEELGQGSELEVDNWFALLSERDAQRFRNELAACEARGTPLRGFRHSLQLPDRAPIQVETDCRAQAGGEGLLAGMTRELAALSAGAEDALRYLNEIPILLAVTDDRGMTELVNKTVLDPMRLKPEAVRGQPFHELPCWAHDPSVQAQLQQAVIEAREGRGVVFELEAHIAGSTLPMKYTCDPIFDDEGEVSALLHTGTPLVEQRRIRNELQRKLELIERQAQVIRVMGTPVLEIWEGVFVIPIVGTLDSARSEALMDVTLDYVTRKGARFGILDITGVDTLDTSAADQLLRVVNAAKLVGATCILTGLSPSIAQTLAQLDVALPDLVTLNNLKSGLRYCLRALS